MNAALLHNWFCAALHWCLGKARVCAEHEQLAMKGLTDNMNKVCSLRAGGRCSETVQS